MIEKTKEQKAFEKALKFISKQFPDRKRDIISIPKRDSLLGIEEYLKKNFVYANTFKMPPSRTTIENTGILMTEVQVYEQKGYGVILYYSAASILGETGGLELLGFNEKTKHFKNLKSQLENLITKV